MNIASTVPSTAPHESLRTGSAVGASSSTGPDFQDTLAASQSVGSASGASSGWPEESAHTSDEGAARTSVATAVAGMGRGAGPTGATSIAGIARGDGSYQTAKTSTAGPNSAASALLSQAQMAMALRAGDKGVADGQALSGQTAAGTVAQTPGASVRKAKTGEAGGDEPAGTSRVPSLVDGALLAMAMPTQAALPVPVSTPIADGLNKGEYATPSVAHIAAGSAGALQHAAGGDAGVAAKTQTAAGTVDSANADGAMGIAGVPAHDATQDAALAATAGAEATRSTKDGKPGALEAASSAAFQNAVSSAAASGNGISSAPLGVQVPGVLGALDSPQLGMGGAGSAVGAVAGGGGGARSTRTAAVRGLDPDASASGLQGGVQHTAQIGADAGVLAGAGAFGGSAADQKGSGADTGAGSAAGSNNAGAAEDARAFSSVSNAGDAAAALPVIGTSRLLQTMSGTEMRVGLHSQEFGSISIATSLSAGSIATQILLEHAALGHALTAHLPAIAEKLESALGMSARVEVRDSSVGAQVQQDSSGSGTQQGGAGAGGQGQAARQGAGSIGGLGALTGREGVSQPAAMAQAMQGGPGRLSIRA